MQQNIWDNENLIKTLKDGGIAVMPTDTIYGIVGNALDESVVHHIYQVRKRNPEKPCIILIPNIDELSKFSIALNEEQKEKLKECWLETRPLSIILYCIDENFTYLHRGTKTLAFRVPHNKELLELLLQVGPLVAPSANTEGLPPSKNIQEAKNYFGDKVDFYVDGGEVVGQASKIIKINSDGSVAVIRE
jgi:L-threonylcarbamoyladenylate synthase